MVPDQVNLRRLAVPPTSADGECIVCASQCKEADRPANRWGLALGFQVCLPASQLQESAVLLARASPQNSHKFGLRAVIPTRNPLIKRHKSAFVGMVA